jgi:hypothetical protein
MTRWQTKEMVFAEDPTIVQLGYSHASMMEIGVNPRDFLLVNI